MYPYCDIEMRLSFGLNEVKRGSRECASSVARRRLCFISCHFSVPMNKSRRFTLVDKLTTQISRDYFSGDEFSDGFKSDAPWTQNELVTNMSISEATAPAFCRADGNVEMLETACRKTSEVSCELNRCKRWFERWKDRSDEMGVAMQLSLFWRDNGFPTNWWIFTTMCFFCFIMSRFLAFPMVPS